MTIKLTNLLPARIFFLLSLVLCINQVFDKIFVFLKVGAQYSVVKMLPVDSKFSWETYDEDVSSLDESSRITAVGLLEHLNVTRDTSDYLWYITR